MNACLSEIRAAPVLDPTSFAQIRRAALLEGCKWDPQVGDVSTLAPFPLFLQKTAWLRLSALAEQLTAEMFQAEQEIFARPKLLEALGLPRRVLQCLRGSNPLSPAAARVVRYDFHPTTEGWQISEANSDVPGGYTESSFFTGLVSRCYPHLQTCGNPAESLVAALLTNIAEAAPTIALLAAPGFLEDLQVTAFVAKILQQHGCRTILCNPRQIGWRAGAAHLNSIRLHSIFRFFQCEWLSKIPSNASPELYFRGAKTQIANPAWTAITESKRFPLIWSELRTSLPTWRALLPETRDPREVPWARDDSWLLKTAFCDTGDTVSIRSLMKPRDWLRVRVHALLHPNSWVAQRRFESVPMETPDGPRHLCLGIYTINGCTAGAYARLAIKPHIDFSATDVSVLLDPNE